MATLIFYKTKPQHVLPSIHTKSLCGQMGCAGDLSVHVASRCPQTTHPAGCRRVARLHAVRRGVVAAGDGPTLLVVARHGAEVVRGAVRGAIVVEVVAVVVVGRRGEVVCGAVVEAGGRGPGGVARAVRVRDGVRGRVVGGVAVGDRVHAAAVVRPGVRGRRPCAAELVGCAMVVGAAGVGDGRGGHGRERQEQAGHVWRRRDAHEEAAMVVGAGILPHPEATARGGGTRGALRRRRG